MLDATAFPLSLTEFDGESCPVQSPAPVHGTAVRSTRPLTAPLDCRQMTPYRRSRNGKRDVRVHLKGIHQVRVKIADGSLATYYYAWRGGPRIKGVPGTPAFIQAYTEAMGQRTKTARGTMLALTGEFRASGEFTSKSKNTQRGYLRYLKLIEAEFGDMPLTALSDPEVRGEFKAWRDTMSANPRKADYAWTTLARVLSIAKDRGRIKVNPCERGGRLYEADRTECLWTDADIAKLEAVASPALRLALTMALWTGQRQGDLLRLRWSDYDGQTIRLVQGKTGARVAVRVGTPLKALLDATKRQGPLVCTNNKGRPWTSDGFRTSWGKACVKAKISGLTFHDLRGSAITRLAMAGATPPEIAGVTGHSIADVSAMLDRHYLGDRVALGEKAIRRLEESL